MKLKTPETMLQGDALREAAATDFRDLNGLVRTALEDYYKRIPSEYREFYDIAGLSSTHVVIERRNGRYSRHAYTIDDANNVTLGEAEEVNKEFIPVTAKKSVFTEAANTLAGGFGSFIEAKDESGKVWEIRVINAGKSKNNVLYPETLLRESVAKFEGARVFQKSDSEHIKGDGKDFGKLIGQLTNPRFIEAANGKPAGINADFAVLQSAGDTAAKIKELYERGMSSAFGFSIDVGGVAKNRAGFREAVSITKVNSVDLIIEPGAGGQLIRLVEAKQEVDTMRDRMIEAVKAANNGQLPSGLDVDNDAALEAAYREALAPNPDNVAIEAAALREAKATARAVIAESTLPAAAKEKLKAQFDAQTARFTEAEVTAAITNEATYLAKFTESGKVKAGDFNDGRVTDDRADRVGAMLDAFFDPANRTVQSFKECYIEITGDKRVTGLTRDADPVRLREALGDSAFREALDSSSWADVLGNSITRRLIADYNQPNQYDVYQQLVSVVPLSDFRTQERTRFGGYGDLPAVAEGAPYNPLTSPSDEKATYAAAKKGGTESITLEMIKNDDVSSIRQVPNKMARAAKRTLAKFVLDFLRTNPAIYDGKALFHADHANLGTAALSAAAFAAARLAMLKQTDMSGNEALGIGPKNLWIPPELEETAVNLFNRNTNLDKTFVQTLSPNIIPVWYWTDASDWCATADVMDIPFIELGFMDGNQEPEIFVQDSPTVGSLFSNDKITYKIRHIYGAGVLDYRGAYKAVVA